jgi:hypothetical protein
MQEPKGPVLKTNHLRSSAILGQMSQSSLDGSLDG